MQRYICFVAFMITIALAPAAWAVKDGPTSAQSATAAVMPSDDSAEPASELRTVITQEIRGGVADVLVGILKQAFADLRSALDLPAVSADEPLAILESALETALRASLEV
jgi:hypothetical protein